MKDSIKQKALSLLDLGEVEELYVLIKPYIEKEDAFAVYLYSTFSLTSFNETNDQFAERNIKLQIMASEGGVAEASYKMGVNYLYGDNVEQNLKYAVVYFERAIEQGHSYSKFTYGYNLYYGTCGISKNIARGLHLMKEAAKEGVSMAVEELNLIAKSGA